VSRRLRRFRRLRAVLGADWVSQLAAHYPDQEALQGTLDESAKTPAIERVAATGNWGRGGASKILGSSLAQSAEPVIGSWLAKHLADLLVCAAIPFLALLPTLGRLADRRAAHVSEQREKRPHVVAAHDLVPYVPLKASDMTALNVDSDAESGKLVDQFKGHYLKRALRSGQTVVTEVVSTRATSLDAHSAVRVTLKTRAATDGGRFPSPANLLLSARGGGGGGAAFNVAVLDVDSDGLTAVVAVSDGDLQNVTTWLGNADAFLAFSLSKQP
jgi:hypothetical protein